MPNIIFAVSIFIFSMILYYYNKSFLICQQFFGTPSKTRTCDSQLRRLLFFQLNYRRIWWSYTDSNCGLTVYETVALPLNYKTIGKGIQN